MVLSGAYEIKAEGQRFGVRGDEPGRPWLRRGKQKQAPPLSAEIYS